MKHQTRLAAACALAVLHTGCQSFRDCSTEDISGAEALPTRLSETGLYSDIGGEVLAEAAVALTPRFPLWTDGAKKRRWLLLPEGTQVDTSDAADWVFPVGTRTFKEFTRDDTRIETRMNQKNEDGWAAVAYVWNEAGDDARRTLGGLEDAAGTEHDVPGAAECLACHGGRPDFTLGFSATQLDVETRAALFDAGLLSDPVEVDVQLDDTARAGLGVLHGNCSHCHNADRNALAQATDCYTLDDNFDLTLPPGLAAVGDAPALQTAKWQVGSTGDSEIIARMSKRNTSEDNPSMPPLGTERVDEAGLAAVEAFVAAHD